MPEDIEKQTNTALRPTGREEELINIISENPLISQAEIADKLGITRSSVSVHITNLLKKGILLGRGYILANTGYPVVIGTANCDYIGSVAPESDVPADDMISDEDAKLNISYAGFAKTVPELLSRYNCQSIPLFAVGDDLFGQQILKDLRQNSISVDSAYVVNGMQTAMYLELHDLKDDRILATASDLGMLEYLTPEYLKSQYRVLQNAGFFAIEDRLPIMSFDYLCTAFPSTPVYFLSSTYRHSLEFREYYGHIHFFLSSLQVAEKLAGTRHMDSPSHRHIAETAGGILSMGSHSVMIPCSGNCLCYALEDTCYIVTCEGDAGSFRFNYCRTAVFATALYCGTVSMETGDFLRTCAAALLLSRVPDEIYNYQHSSISAVSIQEALQNHEFSIISFSLDDGE